MVLEKTGYKVVYNYNHNGKHGLVSATIIGIRTKYKVNEWTVRKKKQGGYAVFDTLEVARDFQRNNIRDLYIFKCKHVRSKSQCLYFYDDCNKKIINRSISLPPSTIVADKVMLLRRV